VVPPNTHNVYTAGNCVWDGFRGDGELNPALVSTSIRWQHRKGLSSSVLVGLGSSIEADTRELRGVAAQEVRS
jgi:hypothetical protein